jgi:hypothetical protein
LNVAYPSAVVVSTAAVLSIGAAKAVALGNDENLLQVKRVIFPYPRPRRAIRTVFAKCILVIVK